MSDELPEVNLPNGGAPDLADIRNEIVRPMDPTTAAEEAPFEATLDPEDALLAAAHTAEHAQEQDYEKSAETNIVDRPKPKTLPIQTPKPKLPEPKKPAPPINFREFDDVETTRRNIYDGVVNAVQQKYGQGLENDRYRIELGDVAYDDKDEFDYAAQKKALLDRKSLNRRLYGRWKMIDKATGKVVDERKEVIAHVPYMTQRGTFISNGSEYTVANQMRLRPGVYTRKKENGEFEAHFNVLPGTGQAFRIHMEPETGVFKFQVGQAHIPLYPVLRNMGISDDQMRKWWGSKLLDANRAKDDPRALEKMYKRMVRSGEAQSKEDRAQAIADTFDKMRLDPDVVKRSLGTYLQPPK